MTWDVGRKERDGWPKGWPDRWLHKVWQAQDKTFDEHDLLRMYEAVPKGREAILAVFGAKDTRSCRRTDLALRMLKRAGFIRFDRYTARWERTGKGGGARD